MNSLMQVLLRSLKLRNSSVHNVAQYKQRIAQSMAKNLLHLNVNFAVTLECGSVGEVLTFVMIATKDNRKDSIYRKSRSKNYQNVKVNKGVPAEVIMEKMEINSV